MLMAPGTSRELTASAAPVIAAFADWHTLGADSLSCFLPQHACIQRVAGIEVFPEHLVAGLKFSWPTYKSGLRVMISAHLQTGSTWAFAEIFRWEVRLLPHNTSHSHSDSHMVTPQAYLTG